MPLIFPPERIWGPPHWSDWATGLGSIAGIGSGSAVGSSSVSMVGVGSGSGSALSSCSHTAEIPSRTMPRYLSLCRNVKTDVVEGAEAVIWVVGLVP